MIKLKNGIEVEYHNEFDIFFQNILEAIIKESQIAAQDNYSTSSESFNDLFLKEIMDNCIYVTHQLFDIAKTNEELSKFMVTGFIFNSIVISLAQIQENESDETIENDDEDSSDDDENKDIIH